MDDLIVAGASNASIIRLVAAINNVSPRWNLIGFVDDDPCKWGRDSYGLPVLGEIALLQSARYRHAYTVCHIYGGSILTRMAVIERMSCMGINWATLVHPAVPAWQTEIGKDCVVFERCCVDFDAKVGDHCILSLGTILGHGSVLEEAVFCGPGVTISSPVRVKRGAMLGAGSVVNRDVTIGEYAMVGVGAAVFSDVPDRATVIGNPARVVLADSLAIRHPI